MGGPQRRLLYAWSMVPPIEKVTIRVVHRAPQPLLYCNIIFVYNFSWCLTLIITLILSKTVFAPVVL